MPVCSLDGAVVLLIRVLKVLRRTDSVSLGGLCEINS